MQIPEVPFISKRPELTGIDIFELKDLYDRHGSLKHDPSKPHRVEFHELIYINEGQGKHFVDFNEYDIKEGSFVFVQKHQVQAFDFKRQPNGLIILFTDEFLADIRTSIRIPALMPNNLTSLYAPVIDIKKQLKKSCESLLSELVLEQEACPKEGLLMQLLFSTLLIKTTREMPDATSNNLSEVRLRKFHHFLQLIKDRNNPSREASDYAALMNMTYKSLNEICKLASKQTAKQMIDAEIILEAKRKLAVEDIQVQVLAYDLGFDEVTNFVKYFKKHTLLTPSQFKQTFKG